MNKAIYVYCRAFRLSMLLMSGTAMIAQAPGKSAATTEHAGSATAVAYKSQRAGNTGMGPGRSRKCTNWPRFRGAGLCDQGARRRRD